MGELTKEITFNNMQDFAAPKIEEKCKADPEPANVWSSLRKIREDTTNYQAIFSSKNNANVETVSIDDIDDMIHKLASEIAEKRTLKPQNHVNKTEKLEKIIESDDLTEVVEKLQNIDENKENHSIIINNANTLNEPFDYDKWKSDMERMYGESKEESLTRSASDEMYLKELRGRIQQSVDKSKKKNPKQTKEDLKTIIAAVKVDDSENNAPKFKDEMSQL